MLSALAGAGTGGQPSQKESSNIALLRFLDVQHRITRERVQERVPTASNVGSRRRCAAVWSRTMGGTPVSPFYSQNQVFSPHRKSATLRGETSHYDNRDREFENSASGRKC